MATFVYEDEAPTFKYENEAPPVDRDVAAKESAGVAGERAKAFGKAAAESTGQATGAFLGGRLGGAAGVAAAGLTGPLAPVTAPVLGTLGTLGGALAGGYLGGQAQELAGQYVPPNMLEYLGFGPQQRAAEKAAYPGYTTAGQIAPDVMGGFGALTATAPSATRPARELMSTARGTQAENLAQGLRTDLTGRLESVIRGAEAAQRAPITQLQRVGAAQTQLGGRAPVAVGRQAAREEQAEQALAQLSPQTNVLAEDVGGLIQNAGRSNIQALRAQRQTGAITDIKDPAFAQAKQREAQGDFIATNPRSAGVLRDVLARVQQQIDATPEPFRSELRRRYAAIRGEERPLTQAESRAAIVRESITGEPARATAIEPLTLEQAEFVRRLLKDKSITEVEGFKALDADRMNKLADELVVAMREYEPRVQQYIDKYREMSAPIERALGGRGKALTEADELAEQQVLFSADKTAATRYYLDGTQERAQRMLDLVGGKTPQTVDAVRSFFRSEMQGMNAKQAADFVGKNEGLLRVFPELRQPLQNIAMTKRTAETLGPAATERARAAEARLSGQAKRAEAELGQAEGVANKFRQSFNQLVTAPADNAATISRSIINDLRASRQIDDKTHRNLLRQINDVETRFAEKEMAKTQLKRLVVSSLQLAGLGTAAYYGGRAVLGGEF
jgi:hypothetical protein